MGSTFGDIIILLNVFHISCCLLLTSMCLKKCRLIQLFDDWLSLGKHFASQHNKRFWVTYLLWFMIRLAARVHVLYLFWSFIEAHLVLAACLHTLSKMGVGKGWDGFHKILLLSLISFPHFCVTSSHSNCSPDFLSSCKSIAPSVVTEVGFLLAYMFQRLFYYPACSWIVVYIYRSDGTNKIM